MYTLGVDIGTFESKGVVVDFAGRIVAQAVRAHQMIVPRAGWAEHRAEEDWWGDFVFIVRALLASSNVKSEDIKAVAHPVLRHRLVLNFHARADNVDTDTLVNRLLEAVPTEMK